MTTETITLSSFLLARIAEDEDAAREATPGPWEHGDRQSVAGVLPEMFGEGKCASCRDGNEPTWKGRRDINGTRKTAHVHTADEPWWPHDILALRESGSVNVLYESEGTKMSAADGAHIARHDPARVLAECAAKRAIVEMFAADYDERGLPSGAGGYGEAYCEALQHLAAVYGSHPDYREAWKP